MKFRMFTGFVFLGVVSLTFAKDFHEIYYFGGSYSSGYNRHNPNPNNNNSNQETRVAWPRFLSRHYDLVAFNNRTNFAGIGEATFNLNNQRSEFTQYIQDNDVTLRSNTVFATFMGQNNLAFMSLLPSFSLPFGGPSTQDTLLGGDSIANTGVPGPNETVFLDTSMNEMEVHLRALDLLGPSNRGFLHIVSNLGDENARTISAGKSGAAFGSAVSAPTDGAPAIVSVVWDRRLKAKLLEMEDVNTLALDRLQLIREVVLDDRESEYLPEGVYYIDHTAHPSEPAHELYAQYVIQALEAPSLIALAQEVPIGHGDVLSRSLARQWVLDREMMRRGWLSRVRANYHFDRQSPITHEDIGGSSHDLDAQFDFMHHGSSTMVGGHFNYYSALPQFSRQRGCAHVASVVMSGVAGFELSPSLLLHGFASWGYINYKTSREFDLGLAHRSHEGRTNGQYLAGNLQLTAPFRLNTYTVSPFFLVRYQTASMARFDESHRVISPYGPIVLGAGSNTVEVPDSTTPGIESSAMSFALPRRTSLKVALGSDVRFQGAAKQGLSYTMGARIVYDHRPNQDEAVAFRIKSMPVDAKVLLDKQVPFYGQLGLGAAYSIDAARCDLSYHMRIDERGLSRHGVVLQLVYQVL